MADQDAFYASVRWGLDELEDGLGGAIAPIVDDARRVGAELQLEAVPDDVDR